MWSGCAWLADALNLTEHKPHSPGTLAEVGRHSGSDCLGGVLGGDFQQEIFGFRWRRADYDLHGAV